MAKWDYTITNGKELREAIDNEDVRATLKAILLCYKELYNKLSDEDKDWKGMDIEDTIFNVENFDPYEDIDGYLEEFYDLCDELRAWVEM